MSQNAANSHGISSESAGAEEGSIASTSTNVIEIHHNEEEEEGPEYQLLQQQQLSSQNSNSSQIYQTNSPNPPSSHSSRKSPGSGNQLVRRQESDTALSSTGDIPLLNPGDETPTAAPDLVLQTQEDSSATLNPDSSKSPLKITTSPSNSHLLNTTETPEDTTPIIPLSDPAYEDSSSEGASQQSHSNAEDSSQHSTLSHHYPAAAAKSPKHAQGAAVLDDFTKVTPFRNGSTPNLSEHESVSEDYSLTKTPLHTTILPNLSLNETRNDSRAVTSSTLLPNLEAPALPSVSSDFNQVTQEYKNQYLERAYLKYLYFFYANRSFLEKNWLRFILVSLLWLIYLAADIISSVNISPSFALKLHPFDSIFYIRIGLRAACFVAHIILVALLIVLDRIVYEAERVHKRKQLAGEMSSLGEALSASSVGRKKSAKEILELKKKVSSKNFKSMRKMTDAARSELFGIRELTTKQLRVALRVLDWALMLFVGFLYLCTVTIVQLRYQYSDQFYYRADTLLFTLALVVLPRIQIRMYLLMSWCMILGLLTFTFVYWWNGLLDTTVRFLTCAFSVVMYCVFFCWLILQFYMMERVRRSRFWNQFWRTEELVLHKKERNRYSQLIKNIVPQELAKYELRNHSRFVSVVHQIPVVMSNLVRFTEFTKTNSSEDIFNVLSILFDCYDSLAIMLSLTKVKMVGDRYFAICLGSHSAVPAALNAVTFGKLMVEAVEKMNGSGSSNAKPVTNDEDGGTHSSSDVNNQEEDSLDIHVAVTSGDCALATLGEHLLTFDVFGKPVFDALQILSEKRKNVVQVTASVATQIAPFFACEEVLETRSNTVFQTFMLQDAAPQMDNLLERARQSFENIRTLNDILSEQINPYSVPLDNFRVKVNSPLSPSPINSPSARAQTKPFGSPSNPSSLSFGPLQQSSITKFGGKNKMTDTPKENSSSDTVPLVAFSNEEEDLLNEESVLLLKDIDVKTRFDAEFEVKFLDEIRKKENYPADYKRVLSTTMLAFLHKRLFVHYVKEHYHELKNLTKLTIAFSFILCLFDMSMYIASFPDYVRNGAHITRYVCVCLLFVLSATYFIPNWANRIYVGYAYSMIVALIHTLLPASLLFLPWSKVHFGLEISVIFSLASINSLHFIHSYVRFILSSVVVTYSIVAVLFVDVLRVEQCLNIFFSFVLFSLYSYRFSSQFLQLFVLQHDLRKEARVHEGTFKNSKYLIYSSVPDRILYKLVDEDEGPVYEKIKNGSVLYVEICNLESLYSQDRLLDVVCILNELYCSFDRIINENQCVKLKSFNFSYSALCFSRDRKNQKHVLTLCKCALSMIEEGRKILHKHNTGAYLKIGIQTNNEEIGSLRGGVIGKTTQSYEMVGNVIHYAKCLAKTSLPFRIHVDQHGNIPLEAVYDLEMRGEITLTGLVGAVQIDDQQVQTYLVLRKHTLASLDNEAALEVREEDGEGSDTEMQELWPI